MRKQRISRLRFHSTLLVFMFVATAILSCSERNQEQLQTAVAQAGQTALVEGEKFAKTQAALLKETAVAQLATQISIGATQSVPVVPSPWDIAWVPLNLDLVSGKLDTILNGTGLEGKGRTILDNSMELTINPAFALAMFRKEAIFARRDTSAYRNKNPGNIIATGSCRGLPTGSLCSGLYGEVRTDGRFGVYQEMDDGIRAYFTLLNNEYKPGTTRNCTDISCIINAYCPPSDCDTATYISQITDWTQDYRRQILSP